MRHALRCILSLALLAPGVVPLAAGASAVTISYLYSLSDFSGTVPYNDVKLYADRLNDEVYAVLGNAVRVFNASGMEIHRFDLDPGVGTVFDLAADESGDLLILGLSLDPAKPGPGWSITRCNYRGQPAGRIAVTGLPQELAAFRPNVMLYRGGRIVLASLAQYRVVVIDRSGAFQKAHDLAKLLGMKDADRAKNDIAAFSMDQRGSMLITIPTLFKAFVIFPEGNVRDVGHAGSAPGAFGVVAGIVGDEHGNLIVADKGRGVVMVFDANLEFVTEFGSGGDGRGGLVRPTDLTLGPAGKIYVTQARDRGVAVLKVSVGSRQPTPPPN
jgi:hypothetical protein